jgi:hypothetical protein
LKTEKVKKLGIHANSVECREFQLEGLLGWKKLKEEGNTTSTKEFEYHEFPELTEINTEKYCSDLQALLINPPWNGKNPKFDFTKFSKLKLPLNKMKEGLIFIWTEKEFISDIIDHFESKDIKYVENLVWVKLDPESKGNF